MPSEAASQQMNRIAASVISAVARGCGPVESEWRGAERLRVAGPRPNRGADPQFNITTKLLVDSIPAGARVQLLKP